MSQEFTTFEIEKRLGIQRNLLAQWLMRGYIVPSVSRATGLGTKNLFSRNDLYKISLFKMLVETGIRRDEAKDYIGINFQWVGGGPKDNKFAVCYRRGKGIGVTLEMELVKEPPTVFRREGGGWTLVIDLLSIKEEVDGKLE